MESDGVLVQRVLAGDTDCFRPLVERYQDAVYGVAFSKTGSFADAEDIAQEAFLAAFESLHELKQPSRFGAWLYGIALNKAKMHLRRQRLRDKLPALAARHEPPADEWIAQQEARAVVTSALGCLSDAHRETATLYYINGYSQEDIAGFTRRPLGTIKRRLHDARQRLRKELIAMVESELKKSRPGHPFTARVLREVRRVRVRRTG
ncbi:MAG: RNA polymerase sigma factor, partial [Planctomycetes bacterium]|nr:RNA polymerase sigma factor [Planctomycetota bacterium]